MEAEYGSLMKGMRAARKKRLATTNGGPPPGMFVAPTAGLSTIVKALGSALGGQSLRLGQRVQQLEPTLNGWRLGVEDATTGRQSTEQYDAVIVAVPAGAAARLLRQIDERAAELLAVIEYSSCVVVQLAYPVDRVRHALDAAGLVVPDVEGRSMQACSFSSVKYAGRAPDGTVLFRAFFGGALRPELLNLDDHSFVDLAKREVGTLLAAEGEPLLTSVTRWRDAMPQYHLGHLHRVDEIQRRIDRHTGLALAGAYLRGVGIPHCIHSGERAADQLLATILQQTESGKPLLAESF
jgi:oxygen-dependent protoporphyrinogen oxidase